MGRWTGGIQVITAIQSCFGRDSALCAAGGGVQLSCRAVHCSGKAGAAIASAACKCRVREHLSRKAAHHSQALCRVLARAEQVPPGSQPLSGAVECVCDSPVPMTHWSSVRGVGEMPCSCEYPTRFAALYSGRLCAVSTMGRRRWDQLPGPAAQLSLPASCKQSHPSGLPYSPANTASGGE